MFTERYVAWLTPEDKTTQEGKLSKSGSETSVISEHAIKAYKWYTR